MFKPTMTKLHIFLLKWIVKKIVVQGIYHQKNIVEYYGVMVCAIGREFHEDNNKSLSLFLQECQDEALFKYFGYKKD